MEERRPNFRPIYVTWKSLVEKTVAILGDRWWPQTAKQDGDRMSKQFPCNIWFNKYLVYKYIMSAQILEVFLLGLGGAVLRLESDACVVNQWSNH